jgi:hypothetical protein
VKGIFDILTGQLAPAGERKNSQSKNVACRRMAAGNPWQGSAVLKFNPVLFVGYKNI